MSNITTTITLSGMTCGACQKVVAKIIGKITDVQAVRVSVADGTAAISATRNISSDEITQSFAGTHYQLITLK